MADVDHPLETLEVAARLCLGFDDAAPTQAALKSAVGDAYYALFSALATSCADSFARKEGEPDRSDHAWVEVYRFLNHGTAADAFIKIRNVPFPDDIKYFGWVFLQLQEARQSAAYNPLVEVDAMNVLVLVEWVHDSIIKLRAATEKDRIALAAWVLFPSSSKGVADARKRARSKKLRDLVVDRADSSPPHGDRRSA